jgi:hypothetical protein
VVGALLAIPLTMGVKIFLEQSDDLRWIAVLLDPVDPQPSSAARSLSSSV